MKQVLLLLADGFEEIEAMGTTDFLRRLGIHVTLAGLSFPEVHGAHSVGVLADVAIMDLKPDTAARKFDAIVLPGGLPGATSLRDSELVQALLQAFQREGKYLAAICAAPIALAKAGILDDHEFTMYPAVALYQDLGDKRPFDAMTVCDGNVITGKGPGATLQFAAAIAGELGLEKEADAELAKMFF